jgi:hypothetical protein
VRTQFPRRPLFREPKRFQSQRFSKGVSCSYSRFLGSIGSEFNAEERPCKRLKSKCPRPQTGIRATAGNVRLDAYLDARRQRRDSGNKGPQKYQVSLYSKELSERPIYVVYYAVARGSEPGYVYLLGKSEEWWRLNVTSIVRGVEGKWFHAWSTWENIVRPLIEDQLNVGHPRDLGQNGVIFRLHVTCKLCRAPVLHFPNLAIRRER